MSAVDHPDHYGGADNPYEAIKVIEAWRLGFHLGNTVKYIARAGAKPGSDMIEDLEKARWYLDRRIARERERAYIGDGPPPKAIYTVPNEDTRFAQGPPPGRGER